MKRPLVILLLLTLIAAGVGLMLQPDWLGAPYQAARRWWQGNRDAQPVSLTAPASASASRETSELVSYRCYFPSRSGFELIEEIRQQPKPATGLDTLRAVITELHRGPTLAASLPLFPEGLAPRAIYLAPDGTAYLDEPAETFARPLGLREEFLFMRALARTLLRNCPEVYAFVLLADGSVRHKLFTHLPAHGRYVLPRTRPRPRPPRK